MTKYKKRKGVGMEFTVAVLNNRNKINYEKLLNDLMAFIKTHNYDHGFIVLNEEDYGKYNIRFNKTYDLYNFVRILKNNYKINAIVRNNRIYIDINSIKEIVK